MIKYRSLKINRKFRRLINTSVGKWEIKRRMVREFAKNLFHKNEPNFSIPANMLKEKGKAQAHYGYGVWSMTFIIYIIITIIWNVCDGPGHVLHMHLHSCQLIVVRGGCPINHRPPPTHPPPLWIFSLYPTVHIPHFIRCGDKQVINLFATFRGPHWHSIIDTHPYMIYFLL